MIVSLKSTTAFGITLFAGIILLTGCGQQSDNTERDTDDKTETSTPPQPTQTGEIDLDFPEDLRTPRLVATTDQPINLPAIASGLAFWEHPTLPFRGLVIAATDSGLFAQTLEADGEPTQINLNINAHDLSLAYLAEDNDAKSVKAVMATFDVTQSAFRFYEIDNNNQRFSVLPLTIPYSFDGLTDICLITDQSSDRSLILTVLSNTGPAIFQFNPYNDEIPTILSLSKKDQPKQVKYCASDPISGTVYGLTNDGTIHDIYPGNDKQSLRTGIPNPGPIAINQTLREQEDRTSQIQTRFMIMDQDSGGINIYDRDTKSAIGIIQLNSFDGIEKTTAASAIATASGNFGALYRFGAIALANDGIDGSPPSVRITPVLAIARAFEFQIDGPVNLRRAAIGRSQQDNSPGLEDLKIQLQPIAKP